MKKSTIEIYALIICFISIITASISFGLVIYSVIGIKCPEITISANEYEGHKDLIKLLGIPDNEYKKDASSLSVEEKEIYWRKSYNKYLSLERQYRLHMLIKYIVVLGVSISVYFAHIVIARWGRSK